MLDVYEIFSSIEGETTISGWPSAFIRLTGCNLRCSWCDTKYAFEGGRQMEIVSIVDEVSDYGLPRVVVTGGEPLTQGESLKLMKALADIGLDVYVETNGTTDIGLLDKRVRVRLDLKPPSSGMTGRTVWQNIDKMKLLDEFKIVIADRDDFNWAVDVIGRYNLAKLCPVNLTPELSSLQPEILAKWVVDNRLDARVNLQMHKMIWGPDARGV